MKKLELKSMAEYFGTYLPAGKIKNRETRISIVMLYGSLAKPAKEMAEEVEAVRKSLTEGKDEELKKYVELIKKSNDASLSEEERKAAKTEAEGMSDCVQIDKDFAEALSKINNEEVELSLKKIPLELLYDALTDCGFPRFSPDMPIAAVQDVFKSVIL